MPVLLLQIDTNLTAMGLMFMTIGEAKNYLWTTWDLK